MANMIKIVLILMIIMLTVGCSPPVVSLGKPSPVPSMEASVMPQETQEVPTESSPTPSPTPENPQPTIRPPKVTLTNPVYEQRLQFNNVFGITLYSLEDARGLTQAAEAGTAWTRNAFMWNSIEPSPGARIWNSELEQGLIRASLMGVEPIMIIANTPKWALKEGFKCGVVDANQFPALAQFAYDLVKRYSVPPYNVRYWELWNEPDAAGFLGCWGDPSDNEYYGGYYYGQMLQAVYPRIKEADQQAQVLVGGLLLDCDPINPPDGRTCVESKFLNGILESGAGLSFDGVSFHAYDFYTGKGTYENGNWNSSSHTTGPVSIAKANYLRRILSDYGYQDKELFNTETAVFWGKNIMDPPCNAPPDQVPLIEATKVNYVIQSYAVALAGGWKANVWFSALGVRCSGLLNSDLSPQDSYYAYQFAQQKLGEAIYVRQISEFDGVMGYEYEITGRNLWVLWSLDGYAHTILLPKQPVEVNQVGEDGQAVKESNSLILTVDLSPRFVEFIK